MQNIEKLNQNILLVMDYKYAEKVAICGREDEVSFVRNILDDGNDDIIMMAYSISEKLFPFVAYGKTINEAIKNLDTKIKTLENEPLAELTNDLFQLSEKLEDKALSELLFAIENVIFHQNYTFFNKIIKRNIEKNKLSDDYYDELSDYIKKIANNTPIILYES